MIHVQKALTDLIENGNKFSNYINVENTKDEKGVAPTLSFTIQSGPIGDVGVNGCQARDMLEYLIYLFTSFNSTVPNRETSITITKLEEALLWQDKRTADREKRKVEGTMNE